MVLQIFKIRQQPKEEKKKKKLLLFKKFNCYLGGKIILKKVPGSKEKNWVAEEQGWTEDLHFLYISATFKFYTM